MEKVCIPDSELPDWAKPKLKGSPPSEVKSNVFGAAKKIAFIIGTAVLVVASVRNSVTWHFERFWGASKYFYQDIWNVVHRDICNENNLVLATIGTHAFLFLYFWMNSIFFMYLDIFKPKYFMKYKIQEDKMVTMPRLRHAVLVCMRNQLIGLAVSFPLYYIMDYRGCYYKAEELPTFQWVLFELIVFILVEEFFFYYSHRLLHHPRIYRHIHKVHHEWTASISIIGIYAHPLEHVVSNLLPVFFGPLLMGSHVATLWMWSCMVITSTQISHGGYHLPFLPSPEAHDYHHLKFINNFGVLGVLDRLHGTDRLFLKTKAYDRHIMLIGLTPAKELFPDDGKKIAQEKKCS